MPIYEYECDICGRRFNLRRHFGDPHPTRCPDGHERVHRVFAPPTIVFKGSGFYVTDNGGNGRPSRSTSQDKKSSESEKQQTKTGEKA